MRSPGSLRSIVMDLLAALLLAAAGPVSAQQAASSCGGDSGIQLQVLGVTRDFLASTDSADVQLRDRLGLSGVSPDSVKLVTDPQVCAHAARRINWLAGEHRKDRKIYAVRVREVWAVHDPTFHLGEWSPLVLFDSRWKLLETLLAM